MWDALIGQPGAGIGGMQQINRGLFKNTRSDPAQHIIFGLTLQNHIVDSSQIQQPPE